MELPHQFWTSSFGTKPVHQNMCNRTHVFFLIFFKDILNLLCRTFKIHLLRFLKVIIIFLVSILHSHIKHPVTKESTLCTYLENSDKTQLFFLFGQQ